MWKLITKEPWKQILTQSAPMSFLICFHTHGLEFLGFVVSAAKLLNLLSVIKIQKSSSGYDYVVVVLQGNNYLAGE